MKVIYVITLFIIYIETIFKILVVDEINITDVLYTLLFSIQAIIIINILCNIFKEKISKAILIITEIILSIYYIIQLIFYNLFSIPFSFSTIGLAQGAFSFKSMIIDAIIDNILPIIIMLIPLILTIIFIKKIKIEKYTKKKILITLLIFILLIAVENLAIRLDNKGEYSAYRLIYEIDAQDKNIKKFGLLKSTIIDIKRTIFGFQEKINIIQNDENTNKTNEEKNNELEEENAEEIKYNVENIELDNLINQTNDENLKDVLEYIKYASPSNQNEYTGYFKDKNLIFILAEGFNEIAVNKELTPTLYKLVNNGFVFKNFYSPVFLSTTGGEFQATTGLIPTQNILSMWKSKMPNIKYALGNSFGKEGYVSNAYHNWTYDYYSRNKTMKTLGFNSYMGIGNGLEKLIDSKWIPRDVDMINATVPFYASLGKFVTYYVTVSGHAPYNFGGGNSTATRYKEMTKNLPYSTEMKAYLATQIELDKAIELLIQKLEEKGILDDTVIALVGDHYPYTLDIDDINTVSNYKKDEIVEVNKSNFIIWNNQMEEPIYIDKIGSQIDVLPTLLNLFGITYDSRLIIGQDILSNKEGIAIFSNRSWVTDSGTYFAATGEFYKKDGINIDDNYIKRINNEVANKFIMSNYFIKYNIYDYVFLTS